MPTPDEMMSAVTDSMAERTGRTLEEWVALVAASGVDPLDQNAVRRWLRDVHGVKQNSQWAIADAAARAAGWVRPTVEEYVDAQYTGAKAALRPIFDAVRAAVLALGDDVVVEGRGTYVPFVRGAGSSPPSRPPRPPGSTSASGFPIRRPATDCSPRRRPGSATHRVAAAPPWPTSTTRCARLLRAAYEQNG